MIQPLSKKPKTSNVQEFDGDRPRCQYLMPHKAGRQCNMTRKSTDKYCAQHALVNDENTKSRQRVPCPLNNSHSVYEDQLCQHLKKCPNRKAVPKENWFRMNYNLKTRSNISKNLIEKDSEGSEYEWIPLVKRVYKLISNSSIEKSMLYHQGLDQRLLQVENKKHSLQQASLIGHMKETGILDDDNIIVEFGCGRAELSRFICRAIALEKLEQKYLSNRVTHSSKFLLIDRDGPRRKFDSKLGDDFIEIQSQKDPSRLINLERPVVERLKVDIKDLDLDKAIRTVVKKTEDKIKISAVSKHLCGCATDLTLQCLQNCDQESVGVKTTGIVIALCCRQLCSYETYPEEGLKWMQLNGINEEAFKAICKMTSWAVCGERESQEENSSERYEESNSPFEDRKQVGLMARKIIDYGRIFALERRGFKARLVEYVTPEITLENVCLIATRED